MKILFVTDLYPLGNEHISKALYYFVREWKKQGHTVDVIRPEFIPNTVIRGRHIQKEGIYTEDDIKIYNLNFFTPFLFNVYDKLPVDFSLTDYDVLISHMPCGALMAQKLLKKEKIKYICGVHSSDITVLTDIKYLPFRKALKKAYLNADKISARSSVLKKKAEKILPNDKTFVAYSGIDEEIIIKPLRKEITLTTAASLIKRKNIDIIINAVKELPQIHLNIIGSGKEEKKLKMLAKNCTNINFLGQIPRKNVIEELKKSDIFALLSDNETFGLCYLEAMATGNIVIGKKDDGLDGIIVNGENGFLISPEKDDLKNCLEHIINAEDDVITRIKENCANTVKEYSMQKAAENYLRNIK